MERTFYIPTSSLNFIGIVASESISPAAYYEKRDYGTRRFVDVFDGRYRNVVVMSDKLSSFSRPVSDMEDHPMLIEIRLDQQELHPLGDGFYTIEKTVQLTPYTTRFLFFSEQNRLVTESLSDHSLEFKLSALYIPRMEVVFPSESYDFSKMGHCNSPLQHNRIANDSRQDRLKGMLYGYHIGALLSSDKMAIEKLKILLAVQDEFSFIRTKGRLDSESENSLRELSFRWRQTSSLYQKLKNAVPDKKVLENILAIFAEEHINLPISNLGISPYLQYLMKDSHEGEENPAIRWIKDEIEKQRNSMLKTRHRTGIEDSAITAGEKSLFHIDIPDHEDLVKHWVNNLLLDTNKIATRKLSKMELADLITDSTMEFIGEKWKDSPERTFLNKLRRHIGGEALDIVWGNDTMSSVAAVVLHGEEWDSLLNFAQRKGMYDYRLLFSLYGVLTGYAGMPRDFVDLLYEGNTDGDAKRIYSEFYRQLSGRELPLMDEKTNIITPLHRDKDVEAILDIIRSHPDYQSKYDKHCKRIEQGRLTDWNTIESLRGWKGFIGKVRPD